MKPIYWIGAVVAVILIAVALALRSCAAPPKPNAVQQAAQQAAAATVTVAYADSVLAHHRADSAAAVQKNLANELLSSQVASLEQQLAAAKAATKLLPPPVDSSAWVQRDSSLTAEVQLADSIIPRLHHEIAQRDTTIIDLTVDNTALAAQLQATRDTLATHRTAVIPASFTPKSTSFLAGLHLGKLVHVVAGYGAFYANQKLQAGPGVSVGVEIPF